MRQALLVIVLVGAAFGGGALVSGPGFRFAQEHLLDYMGLQDGGEIDALDLAPPPDAAAPTPGPLVGAAAVAASKPTPETPAPAPSSPPAPAPAPRPTEPFAETQASQAAATPAPAPEPAKAEPPALLGALSAMLPQAPAPGSTPAGSTRPASEAPAPAPAPAPLDPGVAPSALAPPEAAPAPGPAGTGGDWAEVRRKLAAAGVGRYTIEGEPGGRVVFACLIPVAGKQAVSQRFEAEAADEFQAAQAVLKRINLWRASHPAAPDSP
ncbi:hypothetical protein [Paludisphaera soli]|uniref:hypothetical protein n=1 Tax=Paludisphaera soli TaxID=2712865 RepID=UPI0013ECA791|nr:hypothetical protein [Paludisphaera soli]